MTSTPHHTLSLDEQLAAFRKARFLTMPISGMLAWTGICIAGALLPTQSAILAVYVGTGMIFYLALGVAKLTGEDILARQRKGNLFDRIFLACTGMSLLVFCIAIPFQFTEPTSVPLTVGILTGLMWLPFSVMVGHWVGYFHAIARTILLVVAWYLFPQDRFVVLPAVVVAVYAVTIIGLARRWNEIKDRDPSAMKTPDSMRSLRLTPRAVALGIAIGCSLGVALSDAAVGIALGTSLALVFSYADSRRC